MLGVGEKIKLIKNQSATLEKQAPPTLQLVNIKHRLNGMERKASPIQLVIIFFNLTLSIRLERAFNLPFCNCIRFPTFKPAAVVD